MQNPFTTTFSKTPDSTYITTEKTDEIIDNFSYANPSESVYKITGVRGSGKTVILAKVEEELRKRQDEWLVFDLNPAREMLLQTAAMLIKEGFGKESAKGRSLNISASIFGTGVGIGYSQENDNTFLDIGVEIDQMLQNVQAKNRKILIGIDEVSKTSEMIKFASEYGRWLRAGFPVFLVCTGLYENIQDVSNVKNLTFFKRATTIKTEPLNTVRMSEMYRKQLPVDVPLARAMAGITKGYAYAFQELGVLYFRKKESEILEDIIPQLKSELFAYSYEKVWEELSETDRSILKLMTEDREYKREEIMKLMGDKSANYSVYRDRLSKRGIIETRQAYIAIALPFFADYIKEYCL